MAVTFVVLPLYEFADVGEHWPRDGGYTMIVLTIRGDNVRPKGSDEPG
jgi:hypothetical protein